jgi:hypothetical protein
MIEWRSPDTTQSDDLESALPKKPADIRNFTAESVFIKSYISL